MTAPRKRRWSGPNPGAGFTVALLGFAAVVLAARDTVWTLGHWSQDLSPVPLLAGIALLSSALDGIGALGGVPSERDGALGGSREGVREWQYLGVVITAAGLALLGRSGLALFLSAGIAVALAVVYAVTVERRR